MTIEVLKTENDKGTLDGALAIAFPCATEIEKEGLIGPCFGTVVVDGVAWDWIQKFDRFQFITAC